MFLPHDGWPIVIASMISLRHLGFCLLVIDLPGETEAFERLRCEYFYSKPNGFGSSFDLFPLHSEICRLVWNCQVALYSSTLFPWGFISENPYKGISVSQVNAWMQLCVLNSQMLWPLSRFVFKGNFFVSKEGASLLYSETEAGGRMCLWGTISVNGLVCYQILLSPRDTGELPPEYECLWLGWQSSFIWLYAPLIQH